MSSRLDSILEKENLNRKHFWRVGVYDKDGVGSSIFTDSQFEAVNFATKGIVAKMNVSVHSELKLRSIDPDYFKEESDNI